MAVPYLALRAESSVPAQSMALSAVRDMAHLRERLREPGPARQVLPGLLPEVLRLALVLPLAA